MAEVDDNQWPFFTFGLIVTGKGEEQFLPSLFRSLEATGHCHFRVVRRIGQRSPRTSEKRILHTVGTKNVIPNKDAEQIGLPARRFLKSETDFVILVDDLEADRTEQATEVFQRYRAALDTILKEPQLQRRASVHFFVNMIEAYYFADAKAVNAVLGTNLEDHPGDVETIHHPKNDLKKLCPGGFDEVEHGKEIVAQLDVPHVLARDETCASLRTLFRWCLKAIGQEPTDDFQWASGSFSDVTGKQIDKL